jgi:hypothetical protein
MRFEALLVERAAVSESEGGGERERERELRWEELRNVGPK